MDICIRCQPRTEVSPAPPTATRAALRRRRRLFAEPLCFASCLQMVSLRPVQACFAILHTVGGVIDHPPPPHSSWNWMSVTAALSALSVFGNVLGEERDSDWRVDASDVDTDISSRRNMYNIYSYSYLLVCLSDAGSSSPHACSTSLSRAGMWEVTPSSLTFSSSWTKFLCFFYLFVFRFVIIHNNTHKRTPRSLPLMLMAAV